tara:strand:- start:67 stop:579 length:513 start_codon:yes stop_codon:yes gene_type:complete
MSEDFDKSDGEINPILNALKGAQNTRLSTEERLKKELQEALEDRVSEYIDLLGLSEKIAAKAMKGLTQLSVLLEAHLHYHSPHGLCLIVQDQETGFRFTKTWNDFYKFMQQSLSVPDEIECKLHKEGTGTWENLLELEYPEIRYEFERTKKARGHSGYPNYGVMTIRWWN